jgi:hypothetical protein
MMASNDAFRAMRSLTQRRDMGARFFGWDGRSAIFGRDGAFVGGFFVVLMWFLMDKLWFLCGAELQSGGCLRVL